MIKITKQEREELERVGLIRYRRQYGHKIIQDSNLVITNREHVGKNSKTYYVVEEPNILKFLGRYEGLNMQKITKAQFDLLKEKGLLPENKIQHWGEYKPGAICYENQFGELRIMKVTSHMIALNLWKNNKQKRNLENKTENIEEFEERNEFTELFK